MTAPSQRCFSRRGEIVSLASTFWSIMLPLKMRLAAVATAAPVTPQPAPGRVIRQPNSVACRVGKIRKKFSTTLMAFMPKLTSIGVRASPAARSARLSTNESALKIIGTQMMAK